ncbi:MAG: nitroreductase family protein [Candidatus Omnitrophota bacterium]
MEVMDILLKRRSIRAFKEEPIERKELEKIVEAGRFAPTARNVQPWKFVVVTDKDTLKKLAALTDNGKFLVESAAAIAVLCSDTKYYLEDGCSATVNMLNAAASLGIGSCWVAGDKKEYSSEVLKLLNAPEGFKLISIIALGYPKEEGAFRKAEKKPLQDILRWEKF